MFKLKLIILLGLGIASQANAQQSCLNMLQYYHSNWPAASLSYVCTARGTITLDTNYNYSSCVENLSMSSSDGEFIINSCLSGGYPGPTRSCGEVLRSIHPEWQPNDITYLCTARSRFVADSNPTYSQCVENLSQTSSDGEFIINSCLSGGNPGPSRSCGELLRSIRPDWNATNIAYVCTARSRIVADSIPTYSQCVENLSHTSSDGEFIINTCFNNPDPNLPFPTRSCVEQVGSTHPEWTQASRVYVCSARNRFALDSNLAYTDCVVARSMTSGDGEFIINSCLGGPIQPPPPPPPPPPQYCSCSLVNQWGSFQAQGQNCTIALQNVLNSCSGSNPHAVCSGRQAVCH